MQTNADSKGISSRLGVGILLLVSCCLLSTARMFVQPPNLRHISPDDVSKRSDQRFAALKALLPGNGVIGYIGSTGDSATPDYYLTQYALAPLVVDLSSNHSVVVGNFSSPPAPAIPQNLHLVEDFGNGVMLFVAKDPE